MKYDYLCYCLALGSVVALYAALLLVALLELL